MTDVKNKDTAQKQSVADVLTKNKVVEVPFSKNIFDAIFYGLMLAIAIVGLTLSLVSLSGNVGEISSKLTYVYSSRLDEQYVWFSALQDVQVYAIYGTIFSSIALVISLLKLSLRTTPKLIKKDKSTISVSILELIYKSIFLAIMVVILVLSVIAFKNSEEFNNVIFPKYADEIKAIVNTVKGA